MNVAATANTPSTRTSSSGGLPFALNTSLKLQSESRRVKRDDGGAGAAHGEYARSGSVASRHGRGAPRRGRV
jgi:hypothetical protein